METYHKVTCPLCKQTFTPKRGNISLLNANHIVCPYCYYKMTTMEVRKTHGKTTWDVIRELFKI